MMDNQTERKMFRPENIFLFLAVPFGVFFVFLMPPFQVPDEPVHFLRAWQIAEGRMISEVKDNQAGGFFPEGLVSIASSTAYIHDPNNKQKISVRQIYSLLSVPLCPEKKIFVTPLGSALYSPVPYLPQGIAIFLAKPFSIHPLVLMYWGRIVNLLAWTGLIYLTIRTTPIYPVLFMLLALTPMSLHQAASLSADATTNGLAFLSIALALRLADAREIPVRSRHLLWFSISVVLLSLCKNIYFCFAFLFLLVPPGHLKSRKRYWAWFAAVVGTCLGAAMIWNSIASRVPFSQMLNANIQPAQQAAFVCSHPVEYLRIFFNSVKQEQHLLNLYRTFIGWVGFGDTLLGDWHIRLWTLLLIATAIFENRKDYLFGIFQKILCCVLFVIETGLIYLLLYFFWSPVGSPVIEGIQGRYFIPIAPMAFLLFYNTKLRLPLKVPSFLIAGCVIASLLNTGWVIVCRFYSGF
jgi:uncharacterized membrane protein